MKKIILVCDRCGNELPNKDSTDIYNGIIVKTDFSRSIDPNIIRRRVDHYIKMVSYTTTSGDGLASRSDEERVHFCDKCKDEFVEFFNAPFLEAENDKREKAKMISGLLMLNESDTVEYINGRNGVRVKNECVEKEDDND